MPDVVDIPPSNATIIVAYASLDAKISCRLVIARTLALARTAMTIL